MAQPILRRDRLRWLTFGWRMTCWCLAGRSVHCEAVFTSHNDWWRRGSRSTRAASLWRDTGRVKFLETVRDGRRDVVLAAMVARVPMGIAVMRRLLRTRDGRKRRFAKPSTSRQRAGVVKAIGGDHPLLMDGETFEAVLKKVYENVQRFQCENPLVPGATP